MKINPDDPRLTAYTCGELQGAEKAEVEAALETSPACRHTVDEIRQLATQLDRELGVEPCPELAEPQRQEILSIALAPKIVPFPQRPVFRAVSLGAIAAGLALAVMWLQRFESITPRKIARATDTNVTLSINQVKPATLRPEESPTLAQVDQKTDAIAQSSLVAANPTPSDVPLEPRFQDQSGGAISAEPLNGPQAAVRLRSVITGAGPAQSSPPSPTAAVDRGSITRGLSVASGGRGGIPSANQLNDGRMPPAMADRYGLVPRNGEAAQRLSEAESFGRRVLGESEIRAKASADSKAGTASQPPQIALATSPASPQPGLAPALSLVEAISEPTTESLTRYNVRSADGRSIVAEDKERRELERVEQHRGVQHLYTPLRRDPSPNTASYPRYIENSFQAVLQHPLSTFSLDVDTASYANIRRFLSHGQWPPADAVRIEEMVNYFSYAYPSPEGEHPFSIKLEGSTCPWEADHRLLRVALKGRDIAPAKRPASNFVFLIDVSGSMRPPERLPIIKQGLRMLAKKLNESDRVAIVVYASSSGLVLTSTSCEQKEKILAAIDNLEAGGSTNGGDGIRHAYSTARENFIQGGINRVILCTDGDFNVGVTNHDELIQLIQEKARSGVFLSALGVGTDNYKDSLLQNLADKGNGNYHYIDSIEEAQKVLVEQMNGTLVTIAKDVKIQVEFNPAQVSAYRLIGYEKRILAKEDFSNDAKDAGEIGAGHTVTAFYEIVPAGKEVPGSVGPLKYQAGDKPVPTPAKDSRELLTLKLRYKLPDGEKSQLLEIPYTDAGSNFNQASGDFRFAASVAGFGMVLKNSAHKGQNTLASVLEIAEAAKGPDAEGYRAEFIALIKRARALRGEVVSSLPADVELKYGRQNP